MTMHDAGASLEDRLGGEQEVLNADAIAQHCRRKRRDWYITLALAAPDEMLRLLDEKVAYFPTENFPLLRLKSSRRYHNGYRSLDHPAAAPSRIA